jgi:hypothetical protein
MDEINLIADFEELLKVFEQSYQEHLTVWGGTLDPRMEAKWQELRGQLEGTRSTIVAKQAKLDEMRVKFAERDRKVEAFEQRKRAYQEAAKTGGFPPDPEIDSAPLLSEGAITALIRKLLGNKAPAAPPKPLEDAGDVAELGSDAYRSDSVADSGSLAEPPARAPSTKKTQSRPRSGDDVADLSSGDFRAQD